MFEKAKLLALKALTPLHAGMGSELGIVDLPIQRERHTGFPKIEGSSFKDSRIVLFPVKSMKGVFAYITCPHVLKRLKEDADMASGKLDFKIPALSEGQCSVPEKNIININNSNIMLEEFNFSIVSKCDDITGIIGEKFGLQEEDKQRITVISDDDFADFVSMATEVITRTKINNETGTVAQRALFSEEFLPSESILYSLILFSKSYGKERISIDEVKDKFCNTITSINSIIQLGGDATIGKGIIKLSFVEV